METQPKEIRRYVTTNGKIPFDEWYNALRDRKTQYKIDARLERVALGNLGDYRSVGEGVLELRIHYGSGYRIYFGQSDNRLILLLCGGDKSSQNQDIIKAKEYWRDYAKRKDSP
jgi:putative addiction module killer protein